MKNKDTTGIMFRWFVLFAALSAIAWLAPQEASAQQVSVSFQLFYDELSPHGMWVEYSNYGYVWFPRRDPGFSPYESAGHWVFTEDGWTWVSDYPWGWAPFHYGRWGYDDFYGWYWVPDNVWGPAWVTWRRAPGYYGWAPLRPGISISISFGSGYNEPTERWVFVRERDITRSDVSRRLVGRSRNASIIGKSTVISHTRKDDSRNTTYVAGPERDDVQKATRTSVTPVAIRDNDRPGHRLNDGELRIYRPPIEVGNGNGRRPMPSTVRKVEDIRPETRTNAPQQQRKVEPAQDPRKNSRSTSPQVAPSNRTEKKQQPTQVAPARNERPSRSSQSPAPQSGAKKRKGKE